MTVSSPEERQALRRIGRIVAQVLSAMKRKARPGVTTRELDEYGRSLLEKYGAVSAPESMYNFPGATCICVNEEVAHGIPSDRELKAGDLVNIDVSASKDGFYGDTGASFVLPPVTPQLRKLCAQTQRALRAAMGVARAGQPLNGIGKVIEQTAKEGGFEVIRNLCSHGIGRSLHEPPENILNYHDASDRRILQEGQVITIEPFLSTHAQIAVEQEDGWTLSGPPGNFTAQFEHTMMITSKKPIIFTSAL